jgi:hypothetical protein
MPACLDDFELKAHYCVGSRPGISTHVSISHYSPDVLSFSQLKIKWKFIVFYAIRKKGNIARSSQAKTSTRRNQTELAH